jgi:hypothetical protein
MVSPLVESDLAFPSATQVAFADNAYVGRDVSSVLSSTPEGRQ